MTLSEIIQTIASRDLSFFERGILEKILTFMELEEHGIMTFCYLIWMIWNSSTAEMR